VLILPVVPGMKWCPECQRFKRVAEFFTDRRAKDGKTSYCKPCLTRRNAESKARRARGERVTQRRTRRTLHDLALEKRCPQCGEVKRLDAFAINRSESREIGAYCLPCHNEIVRENVELNHGSTRNYHLKRRYALTSDDVAAMVEAQGGKCAICRVKDAEHVDHDHVTGDVRGILCFTCNVGLGSFNDEPERLLLAHRYLTRPTAESVERVTARLRLISRRAS
jgi:hypothetical protein